MVVGLCEFGGLRMFFSRAEKKQKAKGRVEWRSVGACGRGGAGRRNSLRSDIRRPDRPAVAALPAILHCALPCGYVSGGMGGGVFGGWGVGEGCDLSAMAGRGWVGLRLSK